MAPEAPAPEPGANVRFPPPLLFLATIVAAVLVHHSVWTLPVPLPRWAGLLVGGVCLAAGDGLMLVAHGPFKRTGQDPKPRKLSPVLIREGPSRLSRNPMYLAATVMQIGLGFLCDTVWLLAACGADRSPFPCRPTKRSISKPSLGRRPGSISAPCAAGFSRSYATSYRSFAALILI